MSQPTASPPELSALAQRVLSTVAAGTGVTTADTILDRLDPVIDLPRRIVLRDLLDTLVEQKLLSQDRFGLAGHHGAYVITDAGRAAIDCCPMQANAVKIAGYTAAELAEMLATFGGALGDASDRGEIAGSYDSLARRLGELVAKVALGATRGGVVPTRADFLDQVRGEAARALSPRGAPMATPSKSAYVMHTAGTKCPAAPATGGYQRMPVQTAVDQLAAEPCTACEPDQDPTTTVLVMRRVRGK